MAGSYRVVISPIAAADLDDIYSYIETDSPSAAGDVADRLISKILSLSEMPARGRLVSGPLSGVRQILVRPYLVLYRISDRTQTVIVVRIIHGARSAGED